MFRAAHRSSSGALTVFAGSGLHTHVVTGHSQVFVGTLSLSSHSDTANAVRAPDDERCAARNMLSLQ